MRQNIKQIGIGLLLIVAMGIGCGVSFGIGNSVKEPPTIINNYYYQNDTQVNDTYTNRTYQNETYINETYLNNTQVNETYLNQTYSNQTYTNQTYLNESWYNTTNFNQTYQNTTNINQTYNNDTYINQTYINETYINNTYINETYLNVTYSNETESTMHYEVFEIINLQTISGDVYFFNMTLNVETQLVYTAIRFSGIDGTPAGYLRADLRSNLSVNGISTGYMPWGYLAAGWQPDEGMCWATQYHILSMGILPYGSGIELQWYVHRDDTQSSISTNISVIIGYETW